MRRGACLIGLLPSARLAFATLVALAIAAVATVATFASQAGAVGLGFECVTQNSAGDCAIGEGQLVLSVSDAGGGVVQFEISNTGPERSVVSEVYFDDGLLLEALSVSSSPGVDFTVGAHPPDLPGGQTLQPSFQTTAGLSAEALPSPVANGVGPGEVVVIEFELQVGRSFQDVLDQLASGELRVGLHVIAYESGGSESFVNVPVPEPGTGALVGGGLLGLALRTRTRSGAGDS